MKRILVLMLVALQASVLHAQEDKDGQADLSLEDLLDQRVSSASKYEQKIRNTPASVSIITAEDIEQYGYKTLEDVFWSVRGFYVSNDRNYTYVGVRGFSRPSDYNNRVLLLINGHTVNENVFGSAGLGTELGGLDLGMVERIEIVRGPGSVLYGTNAMFAVVNVITKGAKSAEPVRAAASAGSLGRKLGSVGLAKAFDNGLELVLSAQAADVDGGDVYFPEFDDPSTNNGVALGLDWDDYYGVLGRLQFKGFLLDGMVTSREKGIPTAAWGIDFNDRRGWTIDDHAFVDASSERVFSAQHNLKVRGYYDRYYYKGSYPYDGADSWDEALGERVGGEIRHRWDVRSNNRLIFGGEYQRHFTVDYRAWDADTTYFDKGAPFDVFSFYVHNEFQATSYLSVVLGARHDAYSPGEHATTPRGALILNPLQSTAVKLLYGSAFRVPNLYEHYYEDPNAGFKVNPSIGRERIETLELVWEQRLNDRLSGTVSLYASEMKDLIDTTLDPSDSLMYFTNVTEARTIGFETGLRWFLHRSLRGYANYAFQDAEDAVSNAKLSNSPSHIAKLGVVFPFVRFVYGAVESQYETNRLTVRGTETDGLFLAHVKLTAELERFGSRTTASLQVRNLFDESYQMPAGFECVQPAITQDGRTFLVTVETRF